MLSVKLLGLSVLPLYAADCEKAKAYFDEAKGLNHDIPNLIKKEQLYIKTTKLCPSYAEAHNNLGDMYEKTGRFEEAISAYKKAIELMPSAPYPYFGLGDVYYSTNRLKEAIEWYEKGLRHEPSDKLTMERLSLAKDAQKGVIKAGTIKAMLSATRGAGEVVSIAFGEGLVPFDFNRHDIRQDAKPQLNEIGSALKDILAGAKENKGIPLIEIRGHTDARGADEYNLRLSQRRAEAVARHLTDNFKIPKEWLMPKGYGKRMNICTADSSEPCHALNRRVEIVKTAGIKETTRGSSAAAGLSMGKIVQVEAGFFYQKNGEDLIRIISDEQTRLRSRLDRYFIYLKPLQDCYIYILQEDSSGKFELVFPSKGKDPKAQKGRDYWVPGFGSAYTLDETKGQEKIHVLASSAPLELQAEGIALNEQARQAVRAVRTRIIKVVKSSNQAEQAQAEDLKKPERLGQLLEKIEGEGGWVRTIMFWHE